MRRVNALPVSIFLLAGTLSGVLSLGALLVCRSFVVKVPLRAPVVRVQSIEQVDVFDDAGAEMLMLSLSISNSVPWPNEPIYVDDSGVSLVAKVANHWVPLEGHIGHCALRPGQDSHRVVVVVPSNTTARRVNFKWTNARLTGGRMRWVAERGWLPARISVRLWRLGWDGFPRYRPSSRWQENAVELPIIHGNLQGNA